MAVNQLFYNGKEMFNLINDTVDADHLSKNYTAHDRYGEQIVGRSTFDSDTRDATASSTDIAFEKTAYANGEKITGSVQTVSTLRKIDIEPEEEMVISGPIMHKEGLNISSKVEILKENFNPDNVKIGVPVFMNKGQKEANEPSFVGSFTGDATAVPEDIALGKTAYVNGEKVVGTLDVAELSGVNVTRETDASGGVHVIISLKGGA